MNILTPSYVPGPHNAYTDYLMRQLKSGSLLDLVQRKWDHRISSKWSQREVEQYLKQQAYKHGFSVKQIAQLDCQRIVDRPKTQGWSVATVVDQEGNPVPQQLRAGTLVREISKFLSAFYLTYIYTCRHPLLPVFLIRVQCYDLTSNEKAPLVSQKPVFFAVPSNSPYIFITRSQRDKFSDVILQSLECALPQNQDNVLKIKQDKKMRKINSLQSLMVLYANSRYSNSLGSWTGYAAGSVESVPLATGEQNDQTSQTTIESIAKQLARREAEGDSVVGLSAREVQANYRFKGSAAGKHAEVLYEETEEQKAKRLRMDKELAEENGVDEPRSKYASLAPVQDVSYVIQEPLNRTVTSGIRITFEGTDVFGGLHEAAVTPGFEFLDPETMPTWLTGSEGANCGRIVKGEFRPDMVPP
ncbi:inner kinetochore subunit Chl4p [Diutina catenulata]